MLQSLIDSFLQNQFAQAGVTTVVVGGLIHAARSIPGRIWSFAKARFSSRFVIEDSEELYGAFSAWAVNNLKMWTPESFAAPSDVMREEEHAPRGNMAIPQSSVGSVYVATRGTLVPVSAVMYGRYKGLFVLGFARRRIVEVTGGGKAFVNSLELLFIPGGEKRLRAFVLEVAQSEKNRRMEEKRVPLYRMVSGCWRSCGDVAPRDTESVVLRDGVMEDIVADAKAFFHNRSWYSKRGLPWRRGYLFYGPPGGGKTSTCLGLASALKAPLYALQLASVHDDNALVELFSQVGAGDIVCIEDVDCMSVAKARGQGQDAEGGMGGVTLSGLLNALDGIGSSEGRVVIMTTNHPENLDPALVRSGRIDRRFEFPNADRGQVVRMAAIMEATATEEEVQSLIGKPMADVQNHFIVRENNR